MVSPTRTLLRSEAAKVFDGFFHDKYLHFLNVDFDFANEPKLENLINAFQLLLKDEIISE